MRVLKPAGSIWVNLGDRYSQRVATRRSSHQDGLFPGRPELAKDWKRDRAAGLARMPYENVTHPESSRYVPEKSLMGLPWRYALACIDDLGLILRAEVIWCLSGGARVYARTSTGDRPIMLRDLVRSYRPENIQLWNGVRWTQVLGWNRSPDREGALELELRTGERIGCTPGHRWPTQRGVIRADEIRVGDLITTTALPERDQPRQPSALDDDDIGWLIGLYMAEGSRSEKTIQFAGHVKEEARHARLRRIAEAYDGSCAVYQTSENGVTCNLSGSILRGIIDRYIGAGGTARSKRLRHTVWQRSNRFLAALVDGYLSGDAHFDAKNDRWRLGFTANDEWAADLRTLAARLGAKLSLRRHDHLFGGRKFPGRRGEWRWTRSTHHNVKQDGEVVAIRSSRAREFYDVGVADEPHLFALASGVLTHNSKPNGLPESVTDRVRRSHETWFHFTRQPRYFAAVDEIRERSNPANVRPQDRRGEQSAKDAARRAAGHAAIGHPGKPLEFNPLGKLPASVWEVATEPLKVPAYLGVDHFACVDTETEILTRRGWLRHDEIQVGDEVAGYSLDAGTASWTRCHGVHRYDFDGELVSADARGLSMRLTPNHRTLVHDHRGRHRTRGPVEVIDAAELDKRHSVPRAVMWAEDGREKAVGADFAALLGWVAAEGWYSGDRRRVYLSQSETVNAAKVEQIGALLARLGDDPLRTARVRNWRGREWQDVQWRLGPALSTFVTQTMPDKLLPRWLADLPLNEARALLDAFVDGDGHRRADGRLSLFQKLRHNLDVLQVVAVRLGYNTTLSESGGRWVLYLNPPRPARLRRADGRSLVSRERYVGTVWCVTTGTGTFIARRRGTVFVTGNSFPTEWPRRIIVGWSPSGICTACGEGRRPVVDAVRARGAEVVSGAAYGPDGKFGTATGRQHIERTLRHQVGYACACPDTTAPTTPAVVLDPFSGTGTTPMVAKALGRHGIGVDRSGDYCRLAQWRVGDPAQLAKVRGDRPPQRQIEGQLGLDFEGLVS